ncbi:D-aminoacyl-tRNA deacylase 2-like [Mercenaria mercenaria]|uniref:D-aminoacyl-tRNA deacylase 2-like n=1 Tax=Mercenaria mercenaria TaxID=6596 RepID=UPI00234F02F9|nr:D-aminoacyl-tRNA deacylase 2-like [Mercenaria mercenaria]XP_053406776.1 D-aminoacyl-tRNA deacylase 2-like [Mercenaria mercenaria]
MMASGSSGTSGSDQAVQVRARVILQQCLSAKLMIQPRTDTQEEQHVEIGRGLIVYICFLKGATDDMVERMVKTVLTACLSETETDKLVSVLDLPGDVLIIPQATLGGNLKGKRMQYHRNINKEDGLNLYSKFVQLCTLYMSQSVKCKEHHKVVEAGTYGNRQVFSTQTNGPYTHALEF